MKNLLRICAVCLMAAGLVAPVRAQQGPTKAEFECLMMANSKGVAVAGDPAQSVSYHHVWTPGLSYGYFKSNGLDMVYEVEGTGDEVVIVAHGGLGLPHDYFHPLLSNLTRYARVVYFDRRADMLSAHSSHQMATLDEMAEDIDALRQALGLARVTLLGHSFGGAIALNYALRHPEQVKRLILVNTSAAVENPVEAEKRLLKTLSPAESAAYYSNEGGAAAKSPCEMVRMRYRALYPHYYHKRPDASGLDRGAYAIYYDALAKKLVLAGDRGGFDVTTRLNQIKAPALVFGGKHDLVTPLDQSALLARGLPQSRLVVMEHSGHFPFFEENYLFTEWVRQFMAGTSDSTDDRKTVDPVAGTKSGAR